MRTIATLLALSCLAAAARAERALLPFRSNHPVYVQLPADFPFRFGGVPYKGFWVNPHGNLTFGQPSQVLLPFANAAPFLDGQPMIAPLWVELDPSSGGRVTAGRISADEFEVRWDSVPATGTNVLNSFAVVLRQDGAFRFTYGVVGGAPFPATALAGFTTGRANTLGLGSGVLLSTRTCPAAWGTGGESAIFEFFPLGTLAGVLSGLTLCFAPTLPGSGLLTLADGGSVEIALPPPGLRLWGNAYTSVWVDADGFVSFGGDEPGALTGAAPFVNGRGRLAPAWRDLDPSGGSFPGSAGQVAVSVVPGSFSAGWANVPEAGNLSARNTFAVTLGSAGSVTFTYGALAPVTATSPALVGITGGYPVTAGTETGAPIAPLPQPIPSGTGAVFEVLPPGPFPFANATLAFDGAHATLPGPVPLGDNDAYEVLFPSGFAFPFAGQVYGSAWMTSDGVVSFGANTKELFTLFPFPAPPDFLTGFPRIAGLWADLAPNPGAQPEGAYSVAAGAGAVTFQWSSVPLLGHLGANTFSVTLAPGGGITTTHGPVVTIDAIVGVSAGGAKALGTELPVNLSALPLPIGTGRETAVWEYFTLVSPVDLTGLTLPWSGAGPALYQDAPASPGSVRVALGAGAAEAGRPYVAALSLTSTPGISLPGCPRPIPLGLDPVLLLSLTGGIGGGSGVLDGRGQKDGWPAAPPASPVTIPVPPGLAGRGVTLWFAFVTVAPGGGCPFPFVSPAIAFPIP